MIVSISGENLKEYLQPTKYCDCNHPKIKELAFELTKNCHSKREKAITLFYWVRDNIKFKFDYWGRKTSEVLKRRQGMCTNKTNLLIALLRAVKIPAGYGILKVNTKEFYQELMCPSFRKLVSPITTHIYAGIFLNGKWLICDPSVDKELSKVLRKKTPFAEMSGFKITENRMEKIGGILDRKQFFANIDEQLDKPPKHAKGMVLRILNSYLRFMREKKGRILFFLTAKKIEEKFLNWLRKENIFYFNFLNCIINKVK